MAITFMLGKRGLCGAFIFLFLISLASASFETSSVLLKVSVQEKDSTSSSFSISGDIGGEFSLELVNLQGVNVSEREFVLQAGETKKINVGFDSKGLKPGVYIGSIKISGPKKVSYLPVIFEIETADLFFDMNLDIPPEYSEVSPGDKVVAQIKVFDLTSGGTNDKLGVQPVELGYYVYGVDGGILSSESENVVVDKTVQLTKTLSIPEDAKEGNYVFAAVAKYGSSVGSSSQLFSVKKKSVFDMGGSNSNTLLILGGVLAFFVIIILFFVYLIKDRDKFVIELKKYHSEELKAGKKLLYAQAKIVGRKKKVSEKVLEREVEGKIKELRKKQEQRVAELKTLKKKGNVKEMARRVKEWKTKGYGVGGLEYKLKGLSVSEMKNILKKWNKKYKTEGYKKKK
jgi:hypothetical protein